VLNSWLIMSHVRDLLVRAAFGAVPFELGMSSTFFGLSFLGGPP